MKKFVLILIISCGSMYDFYAQAGIEAQIGGANFLGLTINGRFNIPLTVKNNSVVYINTGVGIMAPWFEPSIMIVNVGAGVKGKALGLGAEVSAFPNTPFFRRVRERNLIDMIVYPNLNYTFQFGSDWYLRLSAGVYLPFSNSGEWFRQGSRLEYQGDVIPGAGIGVGCNLNQ